MHHHIRVDSNRQLTSCALKPDSRCVLFLIILASSFITNLTSGTKLYNDSECVTDIKYVQNRLLMYSGAYPHQGYGHFGSDKEQGRLTINLFLDESQAGSR